MDFAELRASRRIETGGSSYLAKLRSRPGVLPLFAALASTVFHCIQLRSSGREGAEAASHVEPSARNRETSPHPPFVTTFSFAMISTFKKKVSPAQKRGVNFRRSRRLRGGSLPLRGRPGLPIRGPEAGECCAVCNFPGPAYSPRKGGVIILPGNTVPGGRRALHTDKENGGTNAAISDLPGKALCRAIRRSPSSARTRPGSFPRPPARRARPSMPRGRRSVSGRPPPWGRVRASRRPRA